MEDIVKQRGLETQSSIKKKKKSPLKPSNLRARARLPATAVLAPQLQSGGGAVRAQGAGAASPPADASGAALSTLFPLLV